MPPVGAERERREQQGRQAERLAGRRRRVHHGRDPVGEPSGHLAVRPGRDRPAHRPGRPGPLLGGPVGEQCRVEPAVRARYPPGARPPVDGDGGQAAVVHRGEQPGFVLDGDFHAREGREREQQRRPGLGEQPGDKRDGALVAQRQLDHGLEAGRQRVAGAGTRSGEREPQHRHVTGPRRELAGQHRNPADELPGPVARPLHCPGRRPDPRRVAHRDDRREPDAEPPGRDAGGAGVALARRAQRGERLHPGGVERRSGIGRGEHPVPQRQPQPPGRRAACGGVRRVLRELHHDPVPVPAERVVLLRVRVLAEPARRRRPGVKHPPAQPSGVKGVTQPVRHTPTLAEPLPSPTRCSSPRTAGPSWHNQVRRPRSHGCRRSGSPAPGRVSRSWRRSG